MPSRHLAELPSRVTTRAHDAWHNAQPHRYRENENHEAVLVFLVAAYADGAVVFGHPRRRWLSSKALISLS